MEIPMLDDSEFERAYLLYGEGMKNAKGCGMSHREERYRKLLDYYFEVTGFQETVPNAIMHHQISQYGDPCNNCGKPYRKPKAAFCAACGHKK